MGALEKIQDAVKFLRDKGHVIGMPHFVGEPSEGDAPSYSKWSGNPAVSHAARNFACFSNTFPDGLFLGAMLASEPIFRTPSESRYRTEARRVVFS